MSLALISRHHQLSFVTELLLHLAAISKGSVTHPTLLKKCHAQYRFRDQLSRPPDGAGFLLENEIPIIAI